MTATFLVSAAWTLRLAAGCESQLIDSQWQRVRRAARLGVFANDGIDEALNVVVLGEGAEQRLEAWDSEVRSASTDEAHSRANCSAR